MGSHLRRRFRPAADGLLELGHLLYDVLERCEESDRPFDLASLQSAGGIVEPSRSGDDSVSLWIE